MTRENLKGSFTLTHHLLTYLSYEKGGWEEIMIQGIRVQLEARERRLKGIPGMWEKES